MTTTNETEVMDMGATGSEESTNVKCLNLSNLGLKSIDTEVRKYFQYLDELNVSNNEIENVNFCSNLLTKFDCSNNKLSDINFLQHLPNLEELRLSGNSLTLADYYIAATLCPKLKRIDGEATKFNIKDINKQYDHRLWPQILHIWKTKFEKQFFSTKHAKRNTLIKKFTELIETKKLYAEEGLEKFRNFKVVRLVNDLIAELKPTVPLSPQSRTYIKNTIEVEKDNTKAIQETAVIMPAGKKPRSIPAVINKVRGRNLSGPPQHDSTNNRIIKGRNKTSKEIISAPTERKLKQIHNVGDDWSNSAASMRKIDVGPTFDSKCNPSSKIAKKVVSSKAKKLKIEESTTSLDNESNLRNSDDDYPESDISLTTATVRALRFIESSTLIKTKDKETGLFPSPSTSRRNKLSRTSVLQKYNLRKRKEEVVPNKKSRIPAPITRSKNASAASRVTINKIRLRNSPLISSVSRKESKANKIDKGTSSLRTTNRSIRSSRTLRSEIAVYNDIENWCEDINEHFLSDKISLANPDKSSKTSRAVLSAVASRSRSSVKSGVTKKNADNAIRSKASSKLALTDKTQSIKSNVTTKKSKRYRKKLAPLIVSGDDESLDLDPSVHPSVIKSKFVDGSDSESSGNLDQISSKSTWKKINSDSEFSCSLFQDTDSDTDSDSEEEMESSFSKCDLKRSTGRSEVKRKCSNSTRKTSRCNSKTSLKTDDLSEFGVSDIDARDRGSNRQLKQNSPRMNLRTLDFDNCDGLKLSKRKLLSSATPRDTLRRTETSIIPYRCELSESPRSKLADKKSKLSIDERTYSTANLMDRDWNPLHFLKCHSGENDTDNDKTQVWHCAFEPDSFDKRSHRVATCGGQTVCLIDCESGRIINRYKHARLSEEFFTLAWTTLKLNEPKGNKKINILAVGGKRGVILLLQPNQLVCYAELSGHRDMISGLNFHAEMPQILCSGSTDGTIIVWDIGIPNGQNYETEWKHIHIIKVQYDVLNVIFVPQVDFLLAGTENSCWGWAFDARRPSLMTKMPSVEFVHPTKVSGTVQMESVVDAIVLVSKNVVASKCAGYRCIYLWDISATILSTIKKLSRGVRLNIQVLAILQWSDNDNFYLNMGCSKESKILACGDASGKLWIYQLHDLLASKKENQKSQQQVVSPVILIDWPECRLKSNDKSCDREVNLNNVVINSVSVSSDARYITAVTDKNIVCIWN